MSQGTPPITEAAASESAADQSTTGALQLKLLPFSQLIRTGLLAGHT